jgi:prephenate dehydrogenase
MKAREARIIGAGLIGTSIALRLKELGWQVHLRDSEQANEKIAMDLVKASADSDQPELVIIATPPNVVGDVLRVEYPRYPDATFIDISSVKTKVLLEVDSISGLRERFLGTHPIAGRELSGPQSARSDLFEGRAWIITPGPEVDSRTITYIEEFISSLGGISYKMKPEEHDFLFARISHLPQLLSTSLATSLNEVGDSINLAGQGLRDMLRLAGSSGDVWSEILFANSDQVLRSIDELKKKIEEVESALRMKDKDLLSSIFDLANQVNSRLSGKHGLRPRKYSFLNIVIEDKPGQLGALFNECAAIDANVEDLTLEHSPRQETGLIRLALSDRDAKRLAVHLLGKGWKVHSQ